MHQTGAANTALLARGIHHLGLTISDIEAESSFFISVPGFTEVRRLPDYPAIFISDNHIMLTLWQAQAYALLQGFERKHNIGLHHLAMKVESLSRLQELQASTT